MDHRDKSPSDLAIAASGIDSATERLRLASLSAIDPGGARLQGSLDSNALKHLNDMSERVKQATTGIAALTALDKVSNRVANQFKAIEAARLSIPEMPRFEERTYRLPEMPIIQNPLLETNKRLKSIEQRFDKMEQIALNGAEIATSLQVSAATFLDKFEAVAEDNDKTTKRAVWIGLIAVFVAVVIPLLQSLYTEIYRAPSDAAAMQGAISDIKREMQSLQQTQAIVSDKLADALAKNGEQATQTLREIRDILAKQKELTIPPKAATP